VLYGVFLYMGISSLNGSQVSLVFFSERPVDQMFLLQFIDRILIMFMPQKYLQVYMFLRRVNISGVHLFSAIQFICFVFLWVIKSCKPISILFPLMVSARYGLLNLNGSNRPNNCIFTTAGRHSGCSVEFELYFQS